MFLQFTLAPKLQRAHVITACAKERDCVNISTYSLCAPWYTVENCSKAYAVLFHPIPYSQYWAEYNGPTILPLKVRRPSGRLPSVRICGTIDEGRKSQRCNRCSNCKQLAHHKDRYPNQPTPSSSTGYVCVWLFM